MKKIILFISILVSCGMGITLGKNHNNSYSKTQDTQYINVYFRFKYDGGNSHIATFPIIKLIDITQQNKGIYTDSEYQLNNGTVQTMTEDVDFNDIFEISFPSIDDGMFKMSNSQDGKFVVKFDHAYTPNQPDVAYAYTFPFKLDDLNKDNKIPVVATFENPIPITNEIN